MESVGKANGEILEFDVNSFLILILELWISCAVGWRTTLGCLLRGLVGRKEAISIILGVKLRCQTFLPGSRVLALVLLSFFDIWTEGAEGEDEGLLNEIPDHVGEEAEDEQLSQLDKNCGVADHPIGLVNGPASVLDLKAIPVADELPQRDKKKIGLGSCDHQLGYLPVWGSVSICGKRTAMEDAINIVPEFASIPMFMLLTDPEENIMKHHLTAPAHFFGVFDGHGGCQVANYCKDNLHSILVDEIRNADTVEDICTDSTLWERIFTNCFLRVDTEIGGPGENGQNVARSDKSFAPGNVGSTAIAVIICSTHIIVANCGDSRAVLSRGKTAIPLSIDHKPNREDERIRIEAAGGTIFNWCGCFRVMGTLAMSRAIGDRYLKPFVVPNPEVKVLRREQNDECLILATDGLWDVISNDEACRIARRMVILWHKKNGSSFTEGGKDLAAQAAAKYLAKVASSKGSTDNISIIVVDLKRRQL